MGVPFSRFRYNLGTIVFGSLILIVCGIVRCTLNVTYKGLQKINTPATALILLNLKWMFDMMESFLNVVNGRAYIMCAIHGTNFMQSARADFDLLMRNANRVVSVSEVKIFTNYVHLTLK